jgi:hypothetical protein
MTAPFSRQGRTAGTAPGDAAEDNRSDRGQGAPGAPAEITVFKKSDGILSKTITAAMDGSPVSDGSACRMSSGKAKRLPLSDGAQTLADLIENMAPDEALSLGRLVSSVGESAPVTTVSHLKSAPVGAIARSRDFLEFMAGAQAYMLLDVDRKGMPQAVADRINAAGGVVPLLTELFPELMKAARVERPSTSAGISNSATGQAFAGSGGTHIYLLVEDGDDIPRALAALSERLWLNGCGWLNIGSAGQVLVRSIVDASVGSPERLVFEGAPTVEPPLTQDLQARRPTVTLGLAVDTRRAIPSLSEAEQGLLKQIRGAERRRIAAEVIAIRAAADLKLSREIADREGIPIEVARRHVAARHDGILMPAMILVMDDDALGNVTVADVLKNPEAFIGETLADPLEGPAYGRCKAMILRDRETDGVFIKSFAHGGACYRLCYDRCLLEAVLHEADRANAIDIFIAKDVQSHIGPDDEAALIRLVAKLSRLGRSPVRQRLKQERDRRNREKRAKMEAKRPSSTRPVYLAPASDAELTPTMQLLDDVLGRTVAAKTPMRGLSGRLVEIRRLTPLGLHTLTSKGADAERQGSDDIIPAPPEPLIHELTNSEVALLIEEHVEFYKIDKFGVIRTVRLGSAFVSAYKALHCSKLPIVVAVSTAPFVSPVTGGPVAGVGLDRNARIFYEIEPALLQCLPDPAAITDQDAIDAYNFMTNEWLIDVTTDAAGKAVVIAAALTMIQRIVLDQRPAFFIVAGQRGGGKTTVASMTTTAALGRPPAAATWASDEDERRKALLSHLRTGAASIVWDNIPRGTSIKCPHIERALTSAEYTDRVLGVSEQLTVPSFTVMLFTGNNVSPAGDMASRSLVCSIDVTRPDPENRSFIHPDPIAWTLANRSRLMRAFYTLLCWNPYQSPRLKVPQSTAAVCFYSAALSQAEGQTCPSRWIIEMLAVAIEGVSDDRRPQTACWSVRAS